MASVLKKTTGFAVCGSSLERLRILYTNILDVLEKNTEQFTNEKQDVQKFEDQLQGGQIKEMILQAENQLSLARKMMQWKTWKPLVEEPSANQWKWPI
uniref:NADH dehydrogenase [ubiquinone] 1 alpha subcomplex subunit 5 n=1 Tax=Cebus imitator TaxID=2715852 RepID=A0A2K5QLZ0_CEBIM